MCALWWRWQAGTARRDGPALGPASYREIRYEALVAEPTDVLDHVAAFLGLPPSPAMAQYHDGRVRDGPGLSAKQAWLPATPGLRDWRSSMAPPDVELFEALAGDQLEAFGYERVCPLISAGIAARAEACAAWWDAEQARRAARRQAPV